jgi:hypothetical protein
LIVNQNFYQGWKARRRGPRGAATVVDAEPSDGGLIAVPIDPSDTEIELYYVPDVFWTGALLSGSSLVFCLAGLWLTRRRASLGRPRHVSTLGRNGRA